MPTLNKGLNKFNVASGQDLIVESSNDESSAFVHVTGSATLQVTDHDDAETLAANLTEEQNEFEVTWGLYKSFKVSAAEDITVRVVPRKNKIRTSMKKIHHLKDVPEFSQQTSGRFLVGNDDGKFEWGNLNPTKYFTGSQSQVVPSIKEVTIKPGYTVNVKIVEIKGAGFFLDTKFYLYEDLKDGEGNVPDAAEIANPSAFSTNIYHDANGPAKVFNPEDLDTMKFIDADGIIGLLEGFQVNDKYPMVFKGYGGVDLHIDDALTAGKDYHVLVVGANSTKKLYKNLIQL